MTVPSAPLQPDPVFFPMAEFQVEGFLFRVPLYIFQQSQFFRENVLTHSWDEDPPPPPYELPDTTAAEFRDLLRCILPMAPGPFPRYGTQASPAVVSPPPPLCARARTRTRTHTDASGATELTNVLKLATRWQFDFARRVAIRKINYTIDKPALKLTLAREYAVQEFLPGALRGLVDAPALEVGDYALLAAAGDLEFEFEFVAKVVKYRERARCELRESKSKSKSAAAVDVDPEQRRRLVEEIFGAEFARDYKKGEEIVAARAMYVSQQPPPSHRCGRCS